ncbi:MULTISPECIES: thioredoxin family protein [Marinobacter]|uniref:thioredoxin family protein n=1 Tax=Marinobacter TaxID=2742 RepID=UPI000DACB51A|nr:MULTISPECIES: thioredoxin domain-containing protein [Marinobacter]
MKNLVREVSDREFAGAISHRKKTVVVEFWAPWCGPCHTLKPTLAGLAHEFADTVDVVSVNVDLNPETASALGVSNLPALIVFREGLAVARRTGVASLGELRSFLAEAL